MWIAADSAACSLATSTARRPSRPASGPSARSSRCSVSYSPTSTSGASSASRSTASCSRSAARTARTTRAAAPSRCSRRGTVGSRLGTDAHDRGRCPRRGRSADCTRPCTVTILRFASSSASAVSGWPGCHQAAKPPLLGRPSASCSCPWSPLRSRPGSPAPPDRQGGLTWSRCRAMLFQPGSSWGRWSALAEGGAMPGRADRFPIKLGNKWPRTTPRLRRCEPIVARRSPRALNRETATRSDSAAVARPATIHDINGRRARDAVL